MAEVPTVDDRIPASPNILCCHNSLGFGTSVHAGFLSSTVVVVQLDRKDSEPF